MPHLVILYSNNIDAHTDMSALCSKLAATMLTQLDDVGKAVFPPGGIRVFAYPAPHFAIGDGGAAGRAADSSGEYGFVYLNLRMGRGRSEAVHRGVGEAVSAVVKAHFEPLFAVLPIGVTLQIDVGAEVFDAKHSSLHPIFDKPVDSCDLGTP